MFAAAVKTTTLFQHCVGWRVESTILDVAFCLQLGLGLRIVSRTRTNATEKRSDVSNVIVGLSGVVVK